MQLMFFIFCSSFQYTRSDIQNQRSRENNQLVMIPLIFSIALHDCPVFVSFLGCINGMLRYVHTYS
jgi:hypothetical protein